MSNAEQNTGQNKQENEQSEWDSLKEPFDVRNIENPTQDDKSYEAWLRSNANPDELDVNGNFTTPFDTAKIENPTQDDLSYEAWLKSNANPDFEAARDEDSERASEDAAETQPDNATAETSTESEDSGEFDPTRSRWSQMTEEQKYDILHRHPRLDGEKTADWGKRIEAEEGVRIFGVETAAEDNGDSTEAESQAAESVEEASASAESDAAAEGAAEANPTEAVKAEEASDDASSDAERAAPVTEAVSEETEEAAAAEAEQNQEDGEKRKAELLMKLGGGDMAAWVETEKKLTRGALASMEADDLQKLVDEYENQKPDATEGEEVPSNNGEGDASMLGAAVEAMPAQPAPEAVVEQARAEAPAKEEKIAEKPAEKPVEAVEAAEAKTIGEKIEKINSQIDSIREYHMQSQAWEDMRKVLDECSEGVRTSVEYARAKDRLAREEEALDGYRRELRRLPLFTLPWSEARIRKDSLKTLIKTSGSSIEYAQKNVDNLEANLPESLTDEEQKYVDSFAKLDARMDRVNADLHIRADLGGIGMRKKWIEQQRESMGQTGIDAPSDEKREAFIKKTQAEIDAIQKRIDDYQEAHPDFELHPGLDYTNPTYEQIVGEGSVDETSEVEVDETVEEGESYEPTPLEKARARYDEIEEKMGEFRNIDGSMDSEKALDALDRYVRLIDEEAEAQADVVYEEGAEIITDDLHEAWRKEVDEGKDSPVSMANFRSALQILTLMKGGDTERARSLAEMQMKVTSEISGHQLLDLISKYGGDEGAKLAESVSIDSDEAGSAEA